MASNPFASLEIEKDTGSSSVANTESVDAIELDGVVRSRSLFDAPFYERPATIRCVVLLWRLLAL
jgi:hypothetical protein